MDLFNFCYMYIRIFWEQSEKVQAPHQGSNPSQVRWTRTQRSGVELMLEPLVARWYVLVTFDCLLQLVWSHCCSRLVSWKPTKKIFCHGLFWATSFRRYPLLNGLFLLVAFLVIHSNSPILSKYVLKYPCPVENLMR